MSNEKIIIENLENLTLDQAVEYHRILWRGIAEEIENYEDFLRDGDRLKREVLKKYFCLPPDKKLKNNCFLCHYTYKFICGGTFLACGRCPLQDPMKKVAYGCLNGLFSDFLSAFVVDKHGSKAKKIALEIAELPVVNGKRGKQHRK